MNTPKLQPLEAKAGPLAGSIGLHGRTAVFSAMAGGVAIGGVLVASLTLGGRLSGHALFMNATALFIVGAVLGLVHGTVLGFFGRPADVPARDALRDLALAGLYAIPGLAVAWLASVWVALTLIVAYTSRVAPAVGVVLGWAAAAAILSTAAIHAVRALRNAYARWPERRAGTLLVGAAYAALSVLFLSDRPELWGVRLRLTEVGAALLAAALTIWVAGPLVTVALRLLGRLPSPRVRAGLVEGRTGPVDVLVGLAVGGVVGLLAVPFAAGPAPVGEAEAVLTGLAQAVVDEVLLRLFLVTSVAWLLLRWQRVRPAEAAAGAVLTTVLAQSLLYVPGALAAGFPGWTGLAAFMVTAAAVPAVAFGILYWKRGFPAALAADAAAVVAVALLV